MPNERGFEEIDAKSVEFLAGLCEYAGKFGISVAIENLPVFTGATGESHLYSTVDELLSIIGRLHSRNLMNIGVCFDTGHANIGGLNVPEALLKAGAHLKQLHLNDNPGEVKPKAGGDLHLICGEGNIPWREVVRVLREVRYAGPITFELGSRSGHPIDELLEGCIRSWKRISGN